MQILPSLSTGLYSILFFFFCDRTVLRFCIRFERGLNLANHSACDRPALIFCTHFATELFSSYIFSCSRSVFTFYSIFPKGMYSYSTFGFLQTYFQLLTSVCDRPVFSFYSLLAQACTAGLHSAPHSACYRAVFSVYILFAKTAFTFCIPFATALYSARIICLRKVCRELPIPFATDLFSAIHSVCDRHVFRFDILIAIGLYSASAFCLRHRLFFCSASCANWLWDPPILLSEGYRVFFFREKSDRCMKLTTHLHLAPRLKMREVKPLLPRRSSWHGT